MKGEASRRVTTGHRALIGMITPRRMAYLVAWVRMITGAAWLLAPEASARPWVGGAGSDAGVVTLARLIGSRDVVLGVGLLRALRRGNGAREWVAYRSVVDGADALSTAVRWPASASRPAPRCFSAFTLTSRSINRGSKRVSCPEELATRKHEEKEDMTMKTRRTDYDVVPFPPLQHQFGAGFELAHRQHTMHALIEVDVTRARQDIHAYRARTGAPLSLTAFLIGCLARAIDEDRAMQAYRLGRRQLVLFADVDVANVVERDVEGQKLPVWHIIRAANRKSLEAIQQEIRAAQVDKDPQTLTGRPLPRRLQVAFVRAEPLWLLLPASVRRFVFAWMLRNPHRRKRVTGTVLVTALSMFGHGTGWGITPTVHTLGLIVGGLATKPGVVDGQIAEREYLCLTLNMDHDLIDGAPAARFIKRLTDLIESGPTILDPNRSSALNTSAQAGRTQSP